jgi:hypothetical protein
MLLLAWVLLSTQNTSIIFNHFLCVFSAHSSILLISSEGICFLDLVCLNFRLLQGVTAVYFTVPCHHCIH